MSQRTPTTALCRHDLTSVYYREKDLVGELLDGGGDFLTVMGEHILGRRLADADRRVLNAVLIVLMEHGLTPSAIATREVYMSAPENLQGAVAAGLLAVGSQFVGTMENCARLLAELAAQPGAAALRARAEAMAQDHRSRRVPVPGFGHHLHKPDDPRALKLLALADELGLDRGYVRALRALAAAVDRAAGKHVTINATGAIAALLGEIGVPVELMRGFAVVSRAAGLVAHIAEEQQRPSGRFIWDLVDRSLPYAP
ncbi:citryl-CoA lyase [Phormidium willei BDU 130791]|nr:citryl-CoA lyase [Phormidium willei BDU 130791]